MTVALTATSLAAAIQTAWATEIQRETKATAPHAYLYASAWRACDRRLVLEMTRPDALPPWEPDVLARFRRGTDRERDLLADLARVGRNADPAFEIIGQQERFELKDRKGRVSIVGKLDARLSVNGTRVPLEVKAWAPQTVAKIHQFSDLFDQVWTRAGAYQLLSYLYATGEPWGFLLLDRAGLPLLLPVELTPHLDQLEEFLTRAEHALDHVTAGTLPEFLRNDAAECQRCPFYGALCQPPIAGAGTTILLDPELEAQLERREALRDAAHEFDAIDDEIKGRLRGTLSALVGPFVLEGKWGKQSRLEMPAALKAQYTVTDPKGRFTLTITKV